MLCTKYLLQGLGCTYRTCSVRDGDGSLDMTEEQKAGRRAEVRCRPG